MPQSHPDLRDRLAIRETPETSVLPAMLEHLGLQALPVQRAPVPVLPVPRAPQVRRALPDRQAILAQVALPVLKALQGLSVRADLPEKRETQVLMDLPDQPVMVLLVLRAIQVLPGRDLQVR